MCIVTRNFNNRREDLRIINSDMPYKIIMNTGKNEYSFECFDGKNIIATPPMKDSYDLGEDFNRHVFEYNMSDKTIYDFIAACERIYMDYILVEYDKR